MRTRLALASALVAVSMLGLAGCQAAAPDSEDDTTGQAPDQGDSGGDGGQASGGCVDPVLVDGPATGGEVSITSTAMDPAALTISAGDVVGFTSGDGAVHGLVVGTLSSVTVASSLPEYYRFDGAGVCEAADEIGAGTVTITVQ